MSWILEQCLEDGVEPSDVLEDPAQEYMAERLSTPLQYIEHLDRAFADAYRMGADKVTHAIVEETISMLVWPGSGTAPGRCPISPTPAFPRSAAS